MSSSKRPRTEELVGLSGVNIIPVIDVSLVLLIILLATSPILNLPGFPVDLPKAITSESKEKNITISYSKQGQLAVNEANATMDTLIPVLQKALKENKDFIVIVRADQGVPYGDVEKIMDLAKQAGSERIAIATQQDERVTKK